MKKWIFVLGLVLSFNANAWEACGTDANGNTANCEWQIENGILSIRGTNGKGNIGSWYDNKNAPWKDQTSSVKGIEIDSSIKDLGDSAFSGMISQNSIKIPSGLEAVNGYAFRGITAPEIIIPDTVKKLEYASFDWSHIDRLNIPDSVETIDIAFRGGTFKDIIIPNSVTSIADLALSWCEIETLTIGEDTKFGAIFKPEVEGEPLTDTSRIKIYCIGDTDKCDKNLDDAGYPELKSMKATTKEINGVQYVLDAKGNIAAHFGSRTEKRIYTIDEANQVAGKTNRVSIRYR